MSKKNDWMIFRIEGELKKAHQSRLEEVRARVRYLVNPSELNRELIELNLDISAIWKKLERKVRRKYKNRFQGGKP